MREMATGWGLVFRKDVSAADIIAVGALVLRYGVCI